MTEKPSSFAVFKDLVITPPEDSSNGAVKNPESVDDLPSIPN
jgi:hypothetical protein